MWVNLHVCRDISAFHISVHEHSSRLGCDAVSMGEWFMAFQRIVTLSSSGSRILFLTACAENEDHTMLRNVGRYSSSDTASRPRKSESSRTFVLSLHTKT